MSLPTHDTTHRRRRDRLVLGTAALLVVLTAGLVMFTVLKAERDGTEALERLQRAQVQQLARSMDTRLASALTSFAGIIGTHKWTAQPNEASDRAEVQQLASLNPKARTGFYVIDTTARITNGALLRNGVGVGTEVTRPGIKDSLQGEPRVLGVAPGLTTALPTIAIAMPLRDTGSRVVGAFVAEIEVSAESDFNTEATALRSGETGDFSFIDGHGVVLASSNPSLLGKPLDDELVDGSTGFRRGDGRVAVVEKVPSADWRTVFRQDAEEFDGALTGPLHSALVLIVLAGALAAGLGVIVIARRLRAAREEQRRLQEMSEVREEFISIVSHEVRTPVAGLLGFLQTTLDHWDGMDDDQRQRSISRALSSARRLHSLTRDVLDTSSMETGALAYTFAVKDVRDEVSSAVVAAQDLHAERTIRLTLTDHPAWVRCDAERLQQVLTNLLDNALKSAPASPIDVGVDLSGGEVRVSVADQGPGMSEGELSRVFDKFVRGRTSTPAGTGLGLYISKQIVDAHGGRIEATSAEGHGATVTFSLPLVPAPLQRTAV